MSYVYWSPWGRVITPRRSHLPHFKKCPTWSVPLTWPQMVPILVAPLNFTNPVTVWWKDTGQQSKCDLLEWLASWFYGLWLLRKIRFCGCLNLGQQKLWRDSYATTSFHIQSYYSMLNPSFISLVTTEFKYVKFYHDDLISLWVNTLWASWDFQILVKT